MNMSPDFVAFGNDLLNEIDTQSHFMFAGTTGSGKTLLMRTLCQSVLGHICDGLDHRAIVYDAKQDMLPLLSAYVDRDRLMTLNPFDARGLAWDIATDVTEPRVALEMAFTLIPDANESQPYFSNAARHLTYGVMLSFMLRHLDWSLADVLRALSCHKRCRRVLAQHEYTNSIIDRYFRDKRLLNDIFSTIATKILLYEPIAGCWEVAAERISLTEWARQACILILGNSEVSRFAIDNINRCLFKRASDLVLAKPEGLDERSWFFIDEVSEAGRLPLTSLLKKGRSKGARVAIAFQSISGLRDNRLFGQHQTDDILGQIGNRFFGRIECPETAEYASRVVGDQEIRQKTHSQTYSSQGRSETTNTSPVVRRATLPSEFMSINPCDANNGLIGLFTTRSGVPTWDRILPEDLFGGLIPPADDVPDFIPRDSLAQLVRPWTPNQESLFAPPINRNLCPINEIDLDLSSKQRSPQPSSNNDLDI